MGFVFIALKLYVIPLITALKLLGIPLVTKSNFIRFHINNKQTLRNSINKRTQTLCDFVFSANKHYGTPLIKASNYIGFQ